MIDIVTAFFDIGRGTWEGPNLPFYLKRTNDEYFNSFERMCKLQNKIVVYTTENFVERIKSIRDENIDVVVIEDFREIYPDMPERIFQVMNSPDFKKIVKQPYNPEYWNPDYVMVNLLKSHFVQDAIDNKLVNSDLVSWIDFGYCRTDNTVVSDKWDYKFNPNKLHFFNIQSIPAEINLVDIISNNEVYIMGCHIVGGKNVWSVLKESMIKNMNLLLEHGLTDDDQSLLLMSYVQNLEISECRFVDPADWFVIFRKFNDYGRV